MSNNIISVAQFNNYIHDILCAEEILYNIEIYGEVFGIKETNNSLYFNIKDENALLSCVKFNLTNAEYIPKEGDMILVRGSPNYYVKGGKFSFIVNHISPYGQGLLYQQFLLLKEKLSKAGLFDEAHKKQLPISIKRIGVVTSQTGAVFHDIINVTSRRNPMLDIVLFPAKVQGVGATESIIAGIKALEQTDVDVIIIARGGGSMEDLNCFNDEELAYTIYGCTKPIISAVGHETDFTIADFVADIRAPTPSAGAEIVSIDMAKITNNLYNNIARLNNTISTNINYKNNELTHVTKSLITNISDILNKNNYEMQVYENRLKFAVNNLINKNIQDLELKKQRLYSVEPQKIMKMGYSIVYNNDKVIKNINHININDNITIQVSNGYIKANVTDKGDKK